MTRFGLILLALLPVSASAQTIYKCTDAQGGTLISNTRMDKSCRAIVSGPDNALPSPPATRAPRAASNPTPADFPRVKEDTQKARDNDRRHILEQELAGEQRSLEQARKELQAVEATPGAAATPERLAPYRDRVGQHERNIQAIQRELGNLR